MSEVAPSQSMPPLPTPPAVTIPVGAVPPAPVTVPAAGTEQQRQQRRLQGTVPVADVTLIVGYKDQAGQRTEVLHNIDGRDFHITGLQHVMKEKMQKVKDAEGNLVGFEPTGEYEMLIRVSYVAG